MEMEHFATRSGFPVSSIPSIAGIPRAEGLMVEGVGWLNYPRAGFLTFCDREHAMEQARPAEGALILVPDGMAEAAAKAFPGAKLLVAEDPRAAFIDAIEYLQRQQQILPSSLLPPQPAVSPTAIIAAGARVEAGVQVDDGVRVGDGAIVREGTWLKRGVVVGEGSVVGSVGINAYVGRDGVRRGFPHLGGVIVGEGTTLGANCVVVRGILSTTRIGSGCIVGNLVNIGHGAEVGDDAWISVGTMIGGHARIGSKASIAMGCRIRDNIAIGEGASVGMGSVVLKDVDKAASVFGNPARSFIGIAAGPAR